MDKDTPPTMSTREAARILGMHERTVRRWCRDGLLPSDRSGRTYRIPTDIVHTRTASDLITSGEAARILGINPRTLRRWSGPDTHPAPGTWRRYSRDFILDLRDLLDERRTGKP